MRPWLIAALALVLLHVLLRWDDIVRALGRRQIKYGSNALVLVVVLVAILGFVNYFVSRHTKRFDLTKGQRFSLSDQTRKVLAGLKDDVKITYFQRQREMERGQDRLKAYEALSSRLKIEYVDPAQSPTRARPTTRADPIRSSSWRPAASGSGSPTTQEQDITNALIKLTRSGKKTVCSVTGEGERSDEDSGGRGFSGVKSALTKSLYEVKSVFLLREKKVPSDCTVLLVAGPDKDPLPEVTAAIRDYVKGGGKALVMIEAELKDAYPNLAALLKEWNIEAGQNILMRSAWELSAFPARRSDGLPEPRHHQGPGRGHDQLPGRAQRRGRQEHGRGRDGAEPGADLGRVLGRDEHRRGAQGRGGVRRQGRSARADRPRRGGHRPWSGPRSRRPRPPQLRLPGPRRSRKPRPRRARWWRWATPILPPTSCSASRATTTCS